MRAFRPGRHSPIRFRRDGQPDLQLVSKSKFHSKWTRYYQGALHLECQKPLQPLCPICQLKWHKAQACEIQNCQLPHWYQSRAEAQTALRLDQEIKSGKIAWWRRARTVELEPKLGSQRPIRYTPDFVVGLRDGQTETWEVKSWPTLTQASRLRIKLYRARAAIHGWPPLRILTGSGRTIDFC